MKSFFGVRGIPHAVLIDASGEVAWRGHPGSLKDNTIREALDGALSKPLWKWPKEASKVRKALLAGKLQQALAEAEKVGEEYTAVVRGKISAAASGPSKAYEAGDILRAVELGDAAKKSLKGLPEYDSVVGLMDKIKDDGAAQETLGGQKKLAKLIDKGAELTSKKKLKKLVEDIDKLREKYAGTIVDEQGKEAANALRRKINSK